MAHPSARTAITALVDEHIRTAKPWYSRMRLIVGGTTLIASTVAAITSGSALVGHDQALSIIATVCAALSAISAGLSHLTNPERRAVLYRASLVRLESQRATLSDSELSGTEFAHVRADYENVAMTMSRISNDDAPTPPTPRGTTAPIETIHFEERTTPHTTDGHAETNAV